MRFSWKALLLAPLLVPWLFAGGFTAVAYMLGQGSVQNALASFLILLAPGCIISYGATIFMLLPSLHLLARWRRRPPTWPGVIGLGAALGLVAFLLVSVAVWIVNGPEESGQPDENFFVFLFASDGWAWEPVNLGYPVSGSITAALYWWLAGRWQPRAA